MCTLCAISLGVLIMEVDTIKNSVMSLGRNDFKKVIYMILPKIFNLTIVNVDGKNDGGSDWLIFKDAGGAHTIAVQDTVQDKGWKKKAIDDARKAVANGATRFFFITPKSISRLTFMQLEGSITSSHKVPCTCLGAKEISELIVSGSLVNEFLDAIGAPLARGVASRPDKQEICLHAYVVLSQDADNLKNTVYEDSVLITLWNNDPLSCDELVEAAISLLGCDQSKASQIMRRIDSLLTKGKVIKLQEKLQLAPGTQKDIEYSERIYLQEFKALVSAQTSLMESEHNISWSSGNSQKASMLLAKVFIQRQLESAESAKIKMTAMGLFENMNHAFQELRNFIFELGVPKEKVEDTIKEMLIQAQDLTIVKKLSRAALFVALEGSSAISGSKAIGAPRWSDVSVMLDASVAMPYLCAKMYQPTTGRFASSNYKAIDTLLNLSAKVCIPYFYINECASHLLRAVQYNNLDGYADKLQYSQNRFVAHYYQLRGSGKHVPDNLLEYLATFSPSVKQSEHVDAGFLVRKVMTNLQPLFHDYGVEFEEVPKVPLHYSKDIEVEYTHNLQELNRVKSNMLIEHDISALGHIGRQVAEEYECWIFLTWDRAMISIGRTFDQYGLVISPDIVYDLAKSYRPISESQLCTLAHAIARTQEKPQAISAQIIDRIVCVAGEMLQDWELKKRIDQFTTALLERIDLEDERYNEKMDKEIKIFLKEIGVEEASSGELGPDEGY